MHAPESCRLITVSHLRPHLKMTAEDGKQRLTDVATAETLLRLVLSIPSPKAEAHRVKLFMYRIDQSEKTLVFCATQDHARIVRDLINQMKSDHM